MLKRFSLILFLTIGIVVFAVLPALAESVDTTWVRRYDGPANARDDGQAIAVDGSGNVYVTGRSCQVPWPEGNYDYATIKYYSNGDTAYVRRYNGPENGDDWARAMVVDTSGNAYVTGHSIGSRGCSDYATIKYHSDGDTAWVRRYNGPADSNDLAYAIATDHSGNVYVTGRSYDSLTDFDYATIKYYLNGETAWVRRYNGPGNGYDYASAIAVDDYSNVYVTGSSDNGMGNYDYATVKYSPNGDTAWARTYNGPGNSQDVARAIAIDKSGNIFVTGGSIGSGTSDDFATIKYYPDGDTAWVRRYNGPGNSADHAQGIAVDGSGNVYVTGYSPGVGSSNDYAIIKYYANGDTAWVRRYNGPGNGDDYSRAIAVDPCGNSYVTGYSSNGTDLDYATIKYDSLGNQVWVERYNGPGNANDDAYAIAVYGCNNVHVTGGSWGVGTDWDYATIKYVQGISYVSITESAFVPQTDTIAVGDSVRWTNNGAEPYTTTSDAKSAWDSDTLYPGESFTFQFNSAGSYPYHCKFHPSMTGTIVVQATDVRDETGDRERPSGFTLFQNYPNPFNQTTKIEFTLAKSGFVTLNIYDILGRKVRTLVSGHLSSGYKSVLWDGKNDSGKEVASGIYFYQLKAGDFTQTKKLVLLK